MSLCEWEMIGSHAKLMLDAKPPLATGNHRQGSLLSMDSILLFSLVIIKTVSVSCIYAFLSLYWLFLTVVSVSIPPLHEVWLIKESISVNTGTQFLYEKV